ncbi:aminopeptidase [Candidatus Woesearchaeota archaeon]|nr:aminopeptidase [Candidatus Woesearchaeota archaeon]
MTDPCVKKLAEILVNHSTKVKKGDKVVISGSSIAEPLIREVYKLCIKKGAIATVKVGVPGLNYIFFKEAKEHQLNHYPKITELEAKESDVFISIGGKANTRELSNVDHKKIAVRSKVTDPISKIVLKKRWVGVDYPTNALAQDAGMSLEEYEDFLFGATNQDPKKMIKKLRKVSQLLDKTKKVRIVGKDTDITFSVKGMKSKYEYAIYNVPDGEVFTAPEKYSVEGHIKFTYPAIRAGNEVEGIRLEFEKGKIVKATAEKNEKFLKAMLDMDKGSKYLGEFGIGMNDKVTKFTKNLLFDEKIGGTIHLAIGMAYPENIKNNKKNGNDSALHWDIVKDFRREGGEIWFDNKLVQKSGKWMIKI